MLFVVVMMNIRQPDHAFLDPVNLALSFVLLAFVGVGLYQVINMPIITIENNVVSIRNLFNSLKNEFTLDEIERYMVVIRKNKNQEWENLYLFTIDQKRIRISSSLYLNYDELKSILIHNKQFNTEAFDRMNRRDDVLRSALCAFVAIAALCALIYLYNVKEVKQDELQHLHGTLSHPVEWVHGRKSSTLHLTFHEWNEFSFVIDNLSIEKVDVHALMHEVSSGDTLYFSIEKEVYLKKIDKTMAQTYMDKYHKAKQINIIELRSNQSKFLTLNDYNQVNRSNRHMGMGVFLIVSILFFVLSFVIYFKRVKTTNPDSYNIDM